jgi:ankyrin repeat protein
MRKPSKTALFDACKAWDAATVEAALAAAPDLARATDPKGRTALHLACAVKPGTPTLSEVDGSATVAALLKAGAELEAAAPPGEGEGDHRSTPLWFAVAIGENPRLARFLLERGADASSSLWAAVWRDDDGILGELLKAKPRLGLRAQGETPIFYAARLKRLRTLDLLIDAGADPTIMDDQGRDAVDIAQARRLPKTFIDRLMDARQLFQRTNSGG